MRRVQLARLVCAGAHRGMPSVSKTPLLVGLEAQQAAEDASDIVCVVRFVPTGSSLDCPSDEISNGDVFDHHLKAQRRF